MESRNMLTRCRLCLCEDESFINIFELNDWQGYIAAEVISDLLQFEVSKTDGYPHVVCLTCLTKLTDFKLFKECCRKSKVTYDNMFASSVSLVKDQSEVEFLTIKAEPIYFSDDEDDFSKDVGVSGSALCDEDPLKEASPEEEEMRTAPEKGIGGRKGMFECHHCKKVLTTQRGLKMHLTTHGIGNIFKCTVCDKICGSKSYLARHSRMHTDERPYKCTGCSKQFRQGSSLQIHMRIHTKSKPFKCEECNLSFTQSGSLRRHMARHSNLKPHCCEVCNATFRYKSTLTNHVKTHSEERSHKCMVCSREFTLAHQLRSHLSVHSGDRPHQCTHCSKGFRWKESLRRHLKRVCEKK